MKCESCNRENRRDAKYCDACGLRLGGNASSTGGTGGKTGPLDGIRVVDWTMWQFGPVSTMMLADLGAEVIKVESLDGDLGRQFNRVNGSSSILPGGLNSYFESLNRQKKSIAIDLKNPKGVQIMYKLVEKSDVFVENFRKGVPERLGLGYDDLVKHNPRIVYGSATGYGPLGPDSGKPAFALTGEARSGSLFWAGPDNGVPYSVGGMADQIAGIMLSYGVLGGLVARERLGIAQKVDASHLGSIMWLGGMRYGMALLSNNLAGRHERSLARNPLWNYYECKDSKWLAFSMNQSDRYWPFLCQAIDRPDLLEDERFDSMQGRTDNRKELVEALDAVIITKTRDEWEETFAGNRDIIWEKVQDVFDLPDDPQVVANNYIVDFDHPVLGPSKWLQTPLGYSKTPLSTRKAAPAHGENTEELLIETLGYTWDDVTTLHDEGVIL
ncbi:MAG: CoA transferase [Chloroflexi bacterium]|nr:CoA transferase [Chloroflexota bacterium]